MTIECSIDLRIWGLDPERVTALMGLQPTKAARATDRIGRSKLTYKEDLWAFASSLPFDKTVREHLESLWPLLSSRADVLADLSQVGGVELSAWVRSYGGDMPDLWFPGDLMRRIGQLGIEFEIDISVLPGPDEVEPAEGPVDSPPDR